MTQTPTKTPTSGAEFPEIEDDAAALFEDAPDAKPGAETPKGGRNIEAMLNVGLDVQIVLGHARLPISQLLKFGKGSVIELDKRIGEPVEVMINDRLVARGDLVKLGDARIGVSLTEIVKDYVAGD